MVRAVEERPRGFSARFDAQWREYKYFLATGDTPPGVHRSHRLVCGSELGHRRHGTGRYAPHRRARLQELLHGRFGRRQATCRNVEEISIASEEILGEPHRVITVRGNAFLHSMVRTIVGTLVMVGRGQRDTDWVAEVLAARDRQAAGENAPARGLIFWSVGY